MEFAITLVGFLSQVFVPAFALWAVAILHASRHNDRLSEVLFLLSLIIVAGLTIRTVTCNDGCWLFHTFSMGLMVVGGVTKRSGSLEELEEAPVASPVP